MNRFSINKIGTLATAILSAGVVSGCEYCQPLLLVTVSSMAIVAVTGWIRSNPSVDLVEFFSHVAH